MHRVFSFVAATTILLGLAPIAWGQQEKTAYRIRSVDSGMVLSVEGNPAETGAKIHQVEWQQHPLQQWKLIEFQGSFQIVNRATGKVLDVADSSQEQGARIVQNAASKAKSQQWAFEKRGKHFAIRNRLSGQLLNVQGASREAGGAIIQWPAADADNELWELVAADANAREIAQCKGNGKPFTSVKFALGGKRAVSADRDSKIVGCLDNRIRVYELPALATKGTRK
ncbi:MAG: RICIN domain-containing protein [Gemmataceae bacterium]